MIIYTRYHFSRCVSPTRRGAHENTCGMRNRRRNFYVSLKVWMLWLGCLTVSITTVYGACDRPHGACHRPPCLRVVNSGIHAPHPRDGESSSSLSNPLSSLTSSISSTSDLAASVLSFSWVKTYGPQFDHTLGDSRRIPGRGNYVVEF